MPEGKLDAAISLAERIREAVEASPIIAGNHTISLTISIGVAELTKEDDIDKFFRRADQALLRAKELGRNRVVFDK